MELVIATTNKGKLREIKDILAGLDVTVMGLDKFPGCPDVVEDGKTFRENALKKARALASFTGRPTLADDSGLEVDAIGGAPGVYSARFSGVDADDASNNVKLLKLLNDVQDRDRGAQFVCSLALVCPKGGKASERVFKGLVRGRITREPKGASGFGYDPLFLYTRKGMTFAEMGPEEKHKVSHRGRALAKLKEYLAGSGLC